MELGIRYWPPRLGNRGQLVYIKARVSSKKPEHTPDAERKLHVTDSSRIMVTDTTKLLIVTLLPAYCSFKTARFHSHLIALIVSLEESSSNFNECMCTLYRDTEQTSKAYFLVNNVLFLLTCRSVDVTYSCLNTVVSWV